MNISKSLTILRWEPVLCKFRSREEETDMSGSARDVIKKQLRNEVTSVNRLLTLSSFYFRCLAGRAGATLLFKGLLQSNEDISNEARGHH